MKRIALFFALLLATLSAQAQTVITITGFMCNVSQTACVLQGDGGQVITLDPQAVTMSIDEVPYAGAVTSYVQTVGTLRLRSYDVTMTFAPTATLDAVHSFSRSGSGRGGWAWRQHWTFFAVTVY